MTEITKAHGVYTEDDEATFLNDPYEFIKVYQGVHPGQRGEAFPHLFIPSPKVFESMIRICLIIGFDSYGKYRAIVE